MQIREVADRETGDALLEQLRDGGLTDAYLVSAEGEGLKISLGLFGDVSGAETIEQQALALGIPAEIVPRTRPGDLYYVDIELPPGRGAGAIIERYGEDQVQLRDEARCPTGG